MSLNQAKQMLRRNMYYSNVEVARATMVSKYRVAKLRVELGLPKSSELQRNTARESAEAISSFGHTALNVLKKHVDSGDLILSSGGFVDLIYQATGKHIAVSYFQNKLVPWMYENAPKIFSGYTFQHSKGTGYILSKVVEEPIQRIELGRIKSSIRKKHRTGITYAYSENNTPLQKAWGRELLGDASSDWAKLEQRVLRGEFGEDVTLSNVGLVEGSEETEEG